MMFFAEGRVETARSARYLFQLCGHIDGLARSDPDAHAQVEWSDHGGLVRFGGGRCALRAESSVLELRAEADNEEELRQMQLRVTNRLETIGRRDHLTVSWTSSRQTGDELTP